MYPWTRKTQLNFGSNPAPESGSRPYSPWRMYASLTAGVCLINILLQVRLLKDILDAWKVEVEKKPATMSISDAYETLELPTDVGRYVEYVWFGLLLPSAFSTG